jgi:hypothetical protein
VNRAVLGSLVGGLLVAVVALILRRARLTAWP